MTEKVPSSLAEMAVGQGGSVPFGQMAGFAKRNGRPTSARPAALMAPAGLLQGKPPPLKLSQAPFW